MHEINIAHRDIKLDNILYDVALDKLKIIDFGFSLVGEKGRKVN